MTQTTWLRRSRVVHSPRLPRSPLSPIFLLVLAAMSPAGAFATPQPGAGAAQSATRSGGAITFDADALRARGIDPAVAAYFSQAARFTPGVQRIKLYVNEESRGTLMARFDSDGQLCVDRALLERGGLRVPEALQGEAAAGCYDYRQDVPQAEITLEPGENIVRLVVPQEALKHLGIASGTYATGGVAGMFNYSVLGMTNQQGAGSGSNFLFGDAEVGVNAGDWIVRSRHSYTAQDGKNSLSHLYTYAQKTFAEQKAMVQAGQINVTGSLLAVPPILGVQYVPDMALMPQQGGPSFEGIANSQSRVDVRQMGVQIFSSVVPAGPFTLSGLPLISSSADLEVTLTENDGTQRRYTVPAASLRPGARPPQGLSVAVGQVRDVSNAGIDTPLVVTATKGWNVATRYNVTAGGLAAAGYQSAAASVDALLTSRISGNVQATVSNARKEGVRGASMSGSLSMRLTDGLSGTLSATQQTEGFRSIGDTLSEPQDAASARFRNQYTASMTWQNAFIGGITASYSRNSAYYGPSTQFATLSWNRKIGNATLSVNLEKELGNISGPAAASGKNGGVRFYALLSMPLGKANVQSFANNAGGSTRFGAGVSQSLSEALNYSLRAETNPNGNGPNVNGSVSITPRYTQAMLMYSQAGSGNTSYSGQLQGGGVISRAGVTLSPYHIGDTFGVVQAGDLSGVRISTPQGTVWTDLGGRAVIPSLSAYKQSRVELLTKSLPRNVDINNGIEYVEAGRGSFNFVEFGVNKVRRLLLRVTSGDGSALPAALPVLGTDGQYVTTSVGEGIVFLDDIPKTGLQVRLDDGSLCRIEYTLPQKPDPNRPFDAADGVCKA